MNRPLPAPLRSIPFASKGLEEEAGKRLIIPNRPNYPAWTTRWSMSMAVGLKIKEALPEQPGTARDIDNNAGRLRDFFQQFRKLSLAASKTGGVSCVDCGGTGRSVVSRCRRRSFSAKPKTEVGTRCGNYICSFSAGSTFQRAQAIDKMRPSSFDFAPWPHYKPIAFNQTEE